MKILIYLSVTCLLLLLFITSAIFIHLNNNSRPLTKREITELQSVFYEDVNYSKTMITSSSLPPAMAAIVFGNHIVYRKEYHIEDFGDDFMKMGRLVHEICHVWSNQTKGIQTSLIAATEHLRYKDQVYAHDVLTGDKALDEFRYEQQCRILNDFYINRHFEFDTSAYEMTIYKTIKDIK